MHWACQAKLSLGILEQRYRLTMLAHSLCNLRIGRLQRYIYQISWTAALIMLRRHSALILRHVPKQSLHSIHPGHI